MVRIFSFVAVIFVLLVSCQSLENDFTIGTTAAMSVLDPFPEPHEWERYLDLLSKGFDKKTNRSVLWVTGTYSDKGIIFNFPGPNNLNKNVYYSNIDYNEAFFSYFDKINLDVFLLIEPGVSSVEDCLDIVLEKYHRHKSIKGVCIDLEWYNHLSTRQSINTWLEIVLKYDSHYKLLLKHWNINNIDSVLSDNLIYIQSMEGLSNLDEIKKRHFSWFRKFYPAHVGIEIGFESDYNLWFSDQNLLFKIDSDLGLFTLNEGSIYWNEKTIMDFTESLKARD